MSRIPYVPSVEAADAFAAGTSVFYQFGRPASRKLNRAERAAYDAAKVAGYVTTRRGDGAVGDAFFLWCEGAGVPFVRVRVKRRYASVSIDAITLSGAQKLGPGAPAAITELFRAEAAHPATCGIGLVFSYCDRIPIAAAARVAAALVAIARKFPPGSEPAPEDTEGAPLPNKAPSALNQEYFDW